MQHFVLIKFKPGYISENKINQIKKAYSEIYSNMEGVLELQIELNCMERDTNMDLMIRVELAEEALLGEYLQHPIHRSIARDMEPFVDKRVSFDYR